MNDDLVFLIDYAIDNDLINELFEEGSEIKEQDIETDILKVLRDNKIEYKIKLEEKWGNERIIHKYNLVAEVYVNKIDYEKAMRLLTSDQTITDDIDELINAEDIIPDENGDYVEGDGDIEDNSNHDSSNDDKMENMNHKKNTSDSEDAIIDRPNHIPGILSGILLFVFFALIIYYLLLVCFAKMWFNYSRAIYNIIC